MIADGKKAVLEIPILREAGGPGKPQKIEIICNMDSFVIAVNSLKGVPIFGTLLSLQNNFEAFF
mgnify:CR=1 FL=1